MSTNQTNCQNCEKPFEVGFQFCPHCGQKTNQQLTLKVLFYNTIANYFAVDARFFKSFGPLMFKPGFLAAAFVRGKRLLYLHPAQMYLFITVVFFFIFNFYARDARAEIDDSMQDVLARRTEKLDVLKSNVNQDTVRKSDSVKYKTPQKSYSEIEITSLSDIDSLKKRSASTKNEGIAFNFNEEELDSLVALGASDKEIYTYMGMDEDAGYLTRKLYAQILKFYKTMGVGQIYQTFIDSIPLAMFFLLPIFALLLKLFFFNKGRYAHHLVFSFYYFSFLFMVFSIVFAVNRWLVDIPYYIDFLIALSTFFYLFLAIKKFYGQHWIWSFIKSGVVSFLFLMLVLPFSLTILGFIAFFFY